MELSPTEKLELINELSEERERFHQKQLQAISEGDRNWYATKCLYRKDNEHTNTLVIWNMLYQSPQRSIQYKGDLYTLAKTGEGSSTPPTGALVMVEPVPAALLDMLVAHAKWTAEHTEDTRTARELLNEGLALVRKQGYYWILDVWKR